MTQSHSLAALSIFGLVVACSSTDADTPSDPGNPADTGLDTAGTSGAGGTNPDDGNQPQGTGPMNGLPVGPGDSPVMPDGPGEPMNPDVPDGSAGSDGQTPAGGGAGPITPGTGGAGPASGGSDGSPGTVDCSGIAAAGYELCSSSDTSCEAVFTDGAGCAAVCAAAGLTCESAAENLEGACAADTSLPAVECNSGHTSDYCVCGDVGPGGVNTAGMPGSGGASSGGMPGIGGSSTGGVPGSGGSTSVGDLSINDPVPGFASVEGGTTGGGTDIGSAITVNSMSALQDAAESSSPAIILVEPGNYSGTLRPSSNKTIIGTGPGVTINGNISISGSGVQNVIVRNLAVRGLPCSTYDECRAGADAVYVGNGAHHVWLDHLDIADGQDGNCDVTQGGDFVTVSWSHFHYTYDKEHRFSNLIAGSDDEPNSVGKLRITYMNCHWGERVDSRQPRGRFGNIHMLNNYHNTGGGQIHGVGFDMALIAENCVYNENRSIWTDMGSPRGWRGMGNEGTGSDLNASMGNVFDIPYDYTAMPASQVVDAVTSSECGAGNTCTLSL